MTPLLSVHLFSPLCQGELPSNILHLIVDLQGTSCPRCPYARLVAASCWLTAPYVKEPSLLSGAGEHDSQDSPSMKHSPRYKWVNFNPAHQDASGNQRGSPKIEAAGGGRRCGQTTKNNTPKTKNQNAQSMFTSL